MITQYLALRRKENRIYSDAQLLQLPDIQQDHPHYKEWICRKISANWLLNKLLVKSTKSVLDIGCGNGWLSNKIASTGIKVTAIDINHEELSQAKAVFKKPNLEFRLGDIDSLSDETFDAIVFAASIQYFASFESIINKALRHLNDNGCIYIIDSHFYKKGEATIAKQRTIDYYSSLGFEDLSKHYFHHSIDVLSSFKHKILYDPHALKNIFRRKEEPFHRICITRS